MFKVGRVDLFWVSIGIGLGGLFCKWLFSAPWELFVDRLSFQLMTVACIVFLNYWFGRNEQPFQREREAIKRLGSSGISHLNNSRITRNGKEDL